MPNPSELARQEEETTAAPTADAAVILDTLYTRAKRMGYPSIGEALDQLEELREGATCHD